MKITHKITIYLVKKNHDSLKVLLQIDENA